MCFVYIYTQCDFSTLVTSFGPLITFLVCLLDSFKCNNLSHDFNEIEALTREDSACVCICVSGCVGVFVC